MPLENLWNVAELKGYATRTFRRDYAEPVRNAVIDSDNYHVLADGEKIFPSDEKFTDDAHRHVVRWEIAGGKDTYVEGSHQYIHRRKRAQ